MTDMTASDDEALARARFEKREREENGVRVFKRDRPDDSRYSNMYLNDRWLSWLAAWTAARGTDAEDAHEPDCGKCRGGGCEQCGNTGRSDTFLNGNRKLPFDRDVLGRMVREAWVRWALTHPSPKPSWLLPYDDLSESDKEADRQIGEAISRWTLIGDSAARSLALPDASREVTP